MPQCSGDRDVAASKVSNEVLGLGFRIGSSVRPPDGFPGACARAGRPPTHRQHLEQRVIVVVSAAWRVSEEPGAEGNLASNTSKQGLAMVGSGRRAEFGSSAHSSAARDRTSAEKLH